MKRLIVIAGLLLVSAPALATHIATDLVFSPYDSTSSQYLQTAAASVQVNCSSCAVGISAFFADTAPITGWDCWLKPTGSMTGINLQGYMTTDNAGQPSTTVLGSSSPAVAATTLNAAGSVLGMQTFAVQTSSVSLGSRYWLVISTAGGTAPTASNNVAAYYMSTVSDGSNIRDYNGVNWTTVSQVNADGDCIWTHSDGTYEGFISTTTAGYFYTYYANKYIEGGQGESLRFALPPGIEAKVSGVKIKIGKAGSPSDLVVNLYQAGSLVASSTMPAANIVSGFYYSIYFSTPVWVSSTCYVDVRQSGGGGSASNYYGLGSIGTDSRYIKYEVPSDWRIGYSTTPQVPSGYTYVPDVVPSATGPIISNYRSNLTNIPRQVAY